MANIKLKYQYKQYLKPLNSMQIIVLWLKVTIIRLQITHTNL